MKKNVANDSNIHNVHPTHSNLPTAQNTGGGGGGKKSDRFADHLEFVKLVILDGQCLVLTMFTIRRIKEERVL